MIREEIVHVNGVPKKLIIFLHGYLDCSDMAETKLHDFVEALPSAAIHIPQAPFLCEVDKSKRQWYSMYRFDPGYDRKNAPTMHEFLRYYDKMAIGLEETYNYMLPYIESALGEYNLDYKDLYLCGFSQGAMVAIYTALKLPHEIGGIVSFSGIMAGYGHLLRHYNSHPKALLFHGNSDKSLRPESLEFTARKLRKIGCKVTCQCIAGGTHCVNNQELKEAIAFIDSSDHI